MFALDGVFILVTATQIFTGYRLNMSFALLSNTVFYPLAGYFLANILQKKSQGCVLQQFFHLKNGEYTDLAASAVTDIIAAYLEHTL